MKLIYRPRKWQKTSYKEHRYTCGCGACFNKLMKGKTLKNRPQIDYFTYIQGPLWLKRKEEYYQTHKRQCQACGSYQRVDLHHKSYESLGKEKDVDLACLCRPCHDEFHRIFPSKRNLLQQTNAFIMDKQKRIRLAIRKLST